MDKYRASGYIKLHVNYSIRGKYFRMYYIARKICNRRFSQACVSNSRFMFTSIRQGTSLEFTVAEDLVGSSIFQHTRDVRTRIRERAIPACFMTDHLILAGSQALIRICIALHSGGSRAATTSLNMDAFHGYGSIFQRKGDTRAAPLTLRDQARS